MDRGFTLLEIMVVLAVVAIGGIFVGPNFLLMRDNIRTTTAVADLQSLIAFARNEAVRSGNRYVLVIQRGAPIDLASVFYFNGSSSSTVPAASFSAAQMAGTTAAPAGLTFVRANDFQNSIGIGPSSGYPKAFTAPLSGVSGATACSFCSGNYGEVYFETDGSMTLSDGATFPIVSPPSVGVLSLSPRVDWTTGQTSRVHAFTLVSTTGALHVWN